MNENILNKLLFDKFSCKFVTQFLNFEIVKIRTKC